VVSGEAGAAPGELIENRGLVGETGRRRKFKGIAVGELVVAGLEGISLVRMADKRRDSANCGKEGEEFRLGLSEITSAS
jgi:hypothetical protein